MSPYRNIAHKLINRLNIIYKEAILNDIISIINLAHMNSFLYMVSLFINIRQIKKNII